MASPPVEPSSPPPGPARRRSRWDWPSRQPPPTCRHPARLATPPRTARWWPMSRTRPPDGCGRPQATVARCSPTVAWPRAWPRPRREGSADVLAPRSPEISRTGRRQHRPLCLASARTGWDAVTILANFILFQNPRGGRTSTEFAEDVHYDINVANRGDAKLRCHLPVPVLHDDPQSRHLPLQHRADHSPTSAAWNRPQTHTVTRITRSGSPTVLGKGLPVPPVNVGVPAPK